MFTDDQGHNNGTTVSRRIFLGYTAAAISSFISIVAGIPIIGYLLAPLRQKQDVKWISIGRVADFTASIPQMVQFTITRRDGWVEAHDSRTCWIVPQPDGSFLAYNGRCTHLACAYSWKNDGQYAGKFFCPCHDGVYDRNGMVLDGPPPRKLDRLETKVEDGMLMVFYRDFRPGVPNQEPL